MKKVITVAAILFSTALGPLYFTYAGFHGSIGSLDITTRLEVSSDNTNWVNNVAEDNAGGQTLTIAPGGTVYFRLKTWNEGGDNCTGVNFTATFTNQQYLTNSQMFTGAGNGSGDLGDDGDPSHGYFMSEDYNPDTGIASFELDYVQSGSTITSGYQSGGITSQIASSTPEQTVITATVVATDAFPQGYAWQNLFTPWAHADDSATTTVRILVTTPPAAASNSVTTASSPIVSTLPSTGPDPADLP